MLNAFGTWWTQNVTHPFAHFIDTVAGDAENAAELLVEDLVTGIKAAGPALLGQIAMDAVKAGYSNGKVDLTAALNAAKADVTTQGLTVAESVLMGAVSAAAASFEASLAATGTAPIPPTAP